MGAVPFSELSEGFEEMQRFDFRETKDKEPRKLGEHVRLLSAPCPPSLSCALGFMGIAFWGPHETETLFEDQAALGVMCSHMSWALGSCAH